MQTALQTIAIQTVVSSHVGATLILTKQSADFVRVYDKQLSLKNNSWCIKSQSGTFVQLSFSTIIIKDKISKNEPLI